MNSDSTRARVTEESAAALPEYASVPIAFEADRVLDAKPAATTGGGFLLEERVHSTPIRKDYDAVPGNRPTDWHRSFDLTNWGFFAARVNDRRVGGAAVAFRTPGVEMLEGRDDLAVLWDIRVSPDARGQGIGSTMVQAVEAWVRRRGGAWLKVETQNTNVPACRFYARHGFELQAVHPAAYPDFPEEIQLLWYKDLRRSVASGRAVHAVQGARGA